MPVTIDGTSGITTPTYNGADTSEYIVPVTAFKNRIINGAFMIDQRNAGASVTVNTSPVYPVDRFYASANSNGIFTAQRSTTAPSGFTNSIILTVTTPRTSIAAGDVYGIRQPIEGFNVADFGFGTSSAQSITLSFWVRSSITGTYAVAFWNNAFTRNYVATYTINSANTFEFKTITISGDTSGTWTTDNTAGLTVYWDLGSGSNYNGTAGSWAASGAIRTSGSTNWISTNGATFYITGVQLEKGSTATSFDYRPYGTELQLCQRYYEQSTQGLAGDNIVFAGNVTNGQGYYAQKNFIVPKRATPTITGASVALNNMASGFTVAFSTPQGFAVSPIANGTGTGGYWAQYTASAEL